MTANKIIELLGIEPRSRPYKERALTIRRQFDTYILMVLSIYSLTIRHIRQSLNDNQNDSLHKVNYICLALHF